jgi:hypothetical protein
MNDGRKDDKEKSRVDLIPPWTLLSVGKVLAHGAAKYGEDNWTRVENADNRYYAAALRHLLAWRIGDHTDDSESGLPHLSHAICCLMFLLEGGRLEAANRKLSLMSPPKGPAPDYQPRTPEAVRPEASDAPDPVRAFPIQEMFQAPASDPVPGPSPGPGTPEPTPGPRSAQGPGTVQGTGQAASFKPAPARPVDTGWRPPPRSGGGGA